MPQVHTVKQGETLTRIARQYKFASWTSIYNDPLNTEFKKLRPNPNIIFPGDQLNIPDLVPKVMSLGANKKHVFRLKKETEKLRLKIESGRGKALAGKRVVLTVAGEKIDVTLKEDGVIEAELPS